MHTDTSGRGRMSSSFFSIELIKKGSLKSFSCLEAIELILKMESRVDWSLKE